MSARSHPPLTAITLEGFLSFAGAAARFPLGALNVVIGANVSGKSNLVEAFSVLRAAPRDLPLPIRQGGGVKDWLWKGGRGHGATSADDSGTPDPAARIELEFAAGWIARSREGDPAVRYRLVFGAEGDSFAVLDERLENVEPAPDQSRPYFYFGYVGLLAAEALCEHRFRRWG